MTRLTNLASLAKLESALRQFSPQNVRWKLALNELTMEVPLESLFPVMQQLRDAEDLAFDALADVTCVDYSQYGVARSLVGESRFAMVYHLLSTRLNHRLRVRAYLHEDNVVPSMVLLWSCANWLEREVYDLFGVTFTGHPDQRRILTDYGFEGHPLRKDFPLEGNLDLVYNQEKGALEYVPAIVEPRENVHRVRREVGFADESSISPGASVLPVQPTVKK
jgi:NADH-quinone oxidoreductase subunit C